MSRRRARHHLRGKSKNGKFEDKREACLKHCWQRGIHRYGVYIGPDENARLVKQIQDGEAGFVERQSRIITIWVVECQGKKIPVVYDSSRQVIKTCLPMRNIEGKEIHYEGEPVTEGTEETPAEKPRLQKKPTPIDLKVFGDRDLGDWDKAFIAMFNGQTIKVYKTAEEHGFWKDDEDKEIDPRDLNVLGNKLMLVVGELSEAHESIRKQGLDAMCEKPIDITALEEEFADVFIRLMDTGKKLGMDLGRAIVLKAKYNDTRPYKHGKKF